MNKRKITIIITIILLSLCLLSLLIYLSFQKSFSHNEYGEEIIIDNISAYYKKMPETTKNAIFNSLFLTVTDNIDDPSKIPGNGASIRDSNHDDFFDQSTNLHYGNFIVDIESIKQSYRVSFEWSDNQNNYHLSGSPIQITCIDDDLKIYDFNCHEKDSFSEILDQYPIIKILPIEIEAYSDTYELIKYTITYSLSAKNELSIIINNYYGDSYQNALQTLSSRGFNPKDYKIEYNDYSIQR